HESVYFEQPDWLDRRLLRKDDAGAVLGNARDHRRRRRTSCRALRPSPQSCAPPRSIIPGIYFLILICARRRPAICTGENAMRGRRRVDCIGRMVMRPTGLEIASQSYMIFKSLLRVVISFS